LKFIIATPIQLKDGTIIGVIALDCDTTVLELKIDISDLKDAFNHLVGAIEDILNHYE